MRKMVRMRVHSLWLSLGTLLVSSAALCGEFHVYLNNTDHVSGKELTLGEGGLSVVTPYCGKMVIQRSAVKGVSGNSERASEILGSVGENDVVHNRNGDRLSGKVVEIKENAVFIKTFFTGEATARVELDEVDYLTFASGEKAKRPGNADEVRVIFVNGDVVSGRIEGFEEGQLALVPPHCEKMRFGMSAFRSLHNAKESKEFFEGGVAEALMDVLEGSKDIQRSGGEFYPSLVKSFLGSGDTKGALLIFKRMTSYVTYSYAFQRIGDDFLAKNMFDAAIEAYEKMLELSPVNYPVYTKLFDVYRKMGKYKEAAETYEQMFSNPAINLSRYGMSIGKLRVDLSDVYMKLKEYDKAAEQLHRVLIGTSGDETIRSAALTKLIGIYKEQGKIESLTQMYESNLSEKNKTIGEGYVEMVKIYLDDGKFMKAKTYVKRLKELGLSDYAEKAKKLIEEREKDIGRI